MVNNSDQNQVADEPTVVDGKVAAHATERKKAALKELLSAITDENRPNEWDVGPAVGREAW